MMIDKNKLKQLFNRKFNILNEKQYKIIENEIPIINRIFIIEEKEWNKNIIDYRRNFEEHQSTCSNCKSKRNDSRLVSTTLENYNHNRTIYQQYKTNKGYIYYNITECSDCGNQWRKVSYYDTYINRELDYIHHIVDILNKMIEYKTFNKEYDKYKDFHAESMHKVLENLIPLKKIRKINKSIFD